MLICHARIGKHIVSSQIVTLAGAGHAAHAALLGVYRTSFSQLYVTIFVLLLLTPDVCSSPGDEG